MKILILGASGFVGRHFAAALQTNGHEVIRGIRKPRLPTDIAVNFCKDTDKATWLPRLKSVDVVINAVGVLRDSKQQPMALLHEKTPLALFAACQEAGIKRIVQISALGVDKGIETPYFQSRRAVEAYLNDSLNVESMVRPAHHERSDLDSVRHNLKVTSALEDTEPVLIEAEGLVEKHSEEEKHHSIKFLILRPSVIYGEDGASAKMFRLQASLPVQTLPAGGKQCLQPVHIDDICEAVNRWLVDTEARSQTISCVGLEATDMRGMLDSYRQQLGYATALHINIPLFLVGLSARIGDFIPASPLCSDTLTMLNAGNTGDVTAFAVLLDRSPLSYRQFISNPVT